MSAKEQMVILAWVSCSIAALIIALCLMPGLLEIRDKVTGRGKRGHRAGHRLVVDPPGRDPDGDQVEDTQAIEVAA